jgi:hypothetical protein
MSASSRAEPKNCHGGADAAHRFKAVHNSDMIRKTRHVSLWVNEVRRDIVEQCEVVSLFGGFVGFLWRRHSVGAGTSRFSESGVS